MSENSKLISAVLIGAAAGTVLGMLLAPKSGKETIGQIGKCAEDLKLDFEYAVLKAKDVFADFKANITNKQELSTSDLKDEFNNAF